MRHPLAAALSALVLLGPGAALAWGGARLEPVTAAGVQVEMRDGQPVAFSRQAGSTVALVVQQGGYATHDRPILIVSIANAGTQPLVIGPAAIAVTTADGAAVPLFTTEQIIAEAEHDAKVKAEMRQSEAYASAERSFSSANGVLDGAAEASKTTAGMADAVRSHGVLADFRPAPTQTRLGLRAITIAPGQVATLYIPIRKLGGGDGDMTMTLTLGGETHKVPLHLTR
jgi:hypothetical protein